MNSNTANKEYVIENVRVVDGFKITRRAPVQSEEINDRIKDSIIASLYRILDKEE